MAFDPDNWLISLHRVLKDYVLGEIEDSIQVPPGNPIGTQVYDVIFDWPDSAEIAKEAKLPKTIIHFVIDDIDNRRLGFGPNVVAMTEQDNAEPAADLTTPHEAQGHIVNFDIGVWASDQSGGATARLVVYQMLHKLFGTEIAREKTRRITDVEILRFNGGRFITDRINDLRVFRVIDCELEARVYSRTSGIPLVIVDKETVVDENFEIDGLPIS